jgi:hypothetical protein
MRSAKSKKRNYRRGYIVTTSNICILPIVHETNTEQLAC